MDLHNLLVFQDLFNDDVFRDIEKTISRENLNKGAVAAKLINKAEQLGLSGNIIRSYMIYTVAHQSNCVSYAVEKSGGKIGKSLYQAFCHDIELIEKLLLLKPSLLLDCDLLDDYEPTNINQSTAFNLLVENLDKAQTSKDKADVFINYYRTFGSGDMADYRAFRWDSDEDSLVGIKHFETMKLQDLIGYEYQKQELLLENESTIRKRFPYKNREWTDKVIKKPYRRQGKFRREVLKAYNNTCAVCGINEPKILRAAHIVSVANGGLDDIKNGICLCTNHEVAFDNGLLKIRPNGTIEVKSPALQPVFDKIMYPQNEEDYPSKKLLQEKYEMD